MLYNYTENVELDWKFSISYLWKDCYKTSEAKFLKEKYSFKHFPWISVFKRLVKFLTIDANLIINYKCRLHNPPVQMKIVNSLACWIFTLCPFTNPCLQNIFWHPTESFELLSFGVKTKLQVNFKTARWYKLDYYHTKEMLR